MFEKKDANFTVPQAKEDSLTILLFECTSIVETRETAANSKLNVCNLHLEWHSKQEGRKVDEKTIFKE